MLNRSGKNIGIDEKPWTEVGYTNSIVEKKHDIGKHDLDQGTPTQ